MKPGVLWLCLLSGCSFLLPSDDPVVTEFTLTWFCVSPEDCERAEDVARIDRVTLTDFYLHFTSTRDATFGADAQIIRSDSLGSDCSWLYFLSLFGHDLEPQKLCKAPGGVEIQLSIPDPDPATSSKWVVYARRVDLL
jgi:hypothetical protein